MSDPTSNVDQIVRLAGDPPVPFRACLNDDGTYSLSVVVQNASDIGGGVTDAELRAAPLPMSGVVGPQSVTQSAQLAQANDALTLACDNYATAIFTPGGSYTGGTAQIERSYDGGATWRKMAVVTYDSGNRYSVLNAPTFNISSYPFWVVDVTGATHVRYRMQTTPSVGAPTITGRLTAATPSPLMNGLLDENGWVGVTIASQTGGGAYTLIPADNLNSTNATSAGALIVADRPSLYNGVNAWDLQRGNTDISVLTSATRAAAVNTPDQLNVSGRAALITVNVTAAGTGGLTITPKGKAAIPGSYYALGASFPKITTTGLFVFALGRDLPAALGGGFTAQLDTVLPRVWRAEVAPDDGSSWTYSIAIGHLI